MKHKALTLAFLLLATPAWAQDWQVRGICDLRKGAGGARAEHCAQLAAEVLMLLPEKAGPGNVALVADFANNLEQAGVSWEAPCRDQSHCPDTVYTLRYAMASKKTVSIAKDKIFTAFVCREGFSETPQEETACRLKLLNVVRELATRARKENALLAVLKCSGQEEGVTPDGPKVAGFELTYAFVQVPAVLPMAVTTPTETAKQALASLVGPDEPATGPSAAWASSSTAQTPAAQAVRPASASASTAAVVQASSAAAPAARGAGGVVFQVAALATVIQAESVADRLRAQGVEASFEQAEVNGREVYRVLATSQGNPEAFRDNLARMGYPGAILRR